MHFRLATLYFAKSYITQATLFCSQNSPVKLNSSKKHVNCCVFSMSGGHTKNLQKPKENQPPASESGRCAPSRGRAAGDHSRAPHARKAVVLCSRRRCVSGDRHQAHAQSRRSETLEIHLKTKGETACAPGLSQAPWRLPAVGITAPRWRCLAARGAQAVSPKP